MAKVKTPLVVKEEPKGVKVIIQLHNSRPGVEVVISLPVACAWKGRMLDTKQKFTTDNNGKVIVYLPPTNEIKSLSPRGPAVVNYKLESDPIGTLVFQVPNVTEWVLGAEDKKK